MFFRGNELGHLLQTKELMFLEAKNELVFECKKGQTNSKKWPKNHFFASSERKRGERAATESPNQGSPFRVKSSPSVQHGANRVPNPG
jgi:hypothetical protein